MHARSSVACLLHAGHLRLALRHVWVGLPLQRAQQATAVSLWPAQGSPLRGAGRSTSLSARRVLRLPDWLIPAKVPCTGDWMGRACMAAAAGDISATSALLTWAAAVQDTMHHMATQAPAVFEMLPPLHPPQPRPPPWGPADPPVPYPQEVGAATPALCCLRAGCGSWSRLSVTGQAVAAEGPLCCLPGSYAGNCCTMRWLRDACAGSRLWWSWSASETALRVSPGSGS